VAYTAHLFCDIYPYLTPAELITCCKSASGLAEDDPRIVDAIADASLVLYYLTGRQFSGTCTATVRPPCLSGMCSCGCAPAQVNLGLWPVTDLLEVRYGGTVYTGTDLTDNFHVEQFRYLVRNDGQPFLTGNQWAVPGSEQDNADNGFTFEVTVEHGLQVPRLLTRATRALACQLVDVCCGGGSCELPDRVTGISRVGVTQEVVSVMDILEKGGVGIYEVELAVMVFNPSKLQSPSFGWSAQSTYTGRTRY
jgi:hypothetical protein